MTGTDVAAYIGAGAWMPQILSWMYRLLAKPRVRVIPGPTAEIGYTTFGPIVNIPASFFSERADALIHKITLDAEHEKGERRSLIWKWLNETQHQIRLPTGAITAEVVRNQLALALKLNSGTQVDRSIGFQDLDFQAQSQQLAGKLAERYNYLRQQNRGNVSEDLISSQEFMSMRDAFINAMYWKDGRYSFELKIHEVRLRRPYSESFSLTLSRADVERLKANCDQLEGFVRATLNTSQAETKDIIWPTWNWVTLQIVNPAAG